MEISRAHCSQQTHCVSSIENAQSPLVKMPNYVLFNESSRLNAKVTVVDMVQYNDLFARSLGIEKSGS